MIKVGHGGIFHLKQLSQYVVGSEPKLGKNQWKAIKAQLRFAAAGYIPRTMIPYEVANSVKYFNACYLKRPIVGLGCILLSTLSRRSVGSPIFDTAPKAVACFGWIDLDKRFDLWRLPIETSFGGAIATAFGFDLFIAPRCGFNHLAAVDHIM